MIGRYHRKWLASISFQGMCGRLIFGWISLLKSAYVRSELKKSYGARLDPIPRKNRTAFLSSERPIDLNESFLGRESVVKMESGRCMAQAKGIIRCAT
jgi:hypothetical protein